MVYIEFIHGPNGVVSDTLGPFKYVQVTYGSVRVGDEGETFLAEFEDGLWVMDGKEYTDFTVYHKE